MKLQGQGKAPVFCFKGLDDAILAAGRHLKVFCRLFDGLMMQAVDKERPGCEERGEKAVFFDFNMMAELIVRNCGVVEQGLCIAPLYVLNEGPPRATFMSWQPLQMPSIGSPASQARLQSSISHSSRCVSQVPNPGRGSLP